MNKNTPIVGVIIANYNHGQYLERALDSIIDQDYPNKIISLVDDASTDGSLDTLLGLLDNYKQDLPQFFAYGTYKNIPVYIQRNNYNIKQAASRNIAIKTIWHLVDIFAILDADDRMLPGKLSKSIKKILEFPKIVGEVYSDVVINHINKNYQISEYREPFNRRRLEQECIINNSPVITKLALEKVGLYDENLPPIEDYDLHIRITEQFLAVHIPEFLHEYTVTGKNCTDTIPKEIWQSQMVKLRQKTISRLHHS